MKIQTKLIKGIDAKQNPYNAVIPPIFLASTYAMDEIGKPGEYEYQRSKNPTTKAFEDLFSSIEGCKYSFATSTGMGAVTLAFNLLKNGDKIILSSNIYGGTFRYTSNIFENQGIKYELIDDLNELESIDSDVKAVFIETPSNPLLRVTDIEKIVRLAHANGAIVIADNTFLPLYQHLFDFGVDVVLYSATKYIGGHADALAGVVCCNDDKIAARLDLLKNTLGGALAPFDSYTLIRGIKTMGLRMKAQIENTQKIIDFLLSHEGVSKVFYAGSANEYEKALHQKQAAGALGGVISLELKENYNYRIFAKSLKLFDLAVSLGGVESLICQPASMSHGSYTKELREKIGIKDNLLRLAIGCEDGDDLVADITQALDLAKK